MNIVTWSRNPSHKSELDSLLSNTTPWEATTPCWHACVAPWQGEPTLVIVWHGQLHAGALEAQALNQLQTYAQNRMDGSIKKILLAISSAGADIHQPFESLVALNHWIESLLNLKASQQVEVDGVILPPMGTYGGASLMMSSVCDTLWCDSPEDIHLLGSR